MIVLVDTSVWAEYFRRRPRLTDAELDCLDRLIRDDLVAIIRPIQTEVLSGRVKKEREVEVRIALGALRFLDLDWNAAETWDAIVDCARTAREIGAPVVGIVDRMVLLSAERGPAALWTLDRPLASLTRIRNTPLFSA